jgi:starch synthase
MTGLIPLYLKTYYKKEPVFSHSKVIYSIGSTSFKEKLGADFLKLININNSLKEKDLEPFKETIISQ